MYVKDAFRRDASRIRLPCRCTRPHYERKALRAGGGSERFSLNCSGNPQALQAAFEGMPGKPQLFGRLTFVAIGFFQGL